MTDDDVNRCDVEGCNEESEDGCHECEVHWCFHHRYEHECPHEREEE